MIGVVFSSHAKLPPINSAQPSFAKRHGRQFLRVRKVGRPIDRFHSSEVARNWEGNGIHPEARMRCFAPAGRIPIFS
ncbi:hypothetical protein, partial [Mesorhizobium tamadayense]|uniref:hypothetical protein n=1 Tax=Mesorhizobium tamadayense TaxID=425306 RepID=UPI00197FA903